MAAVLSRSTHPHGLAMETRTMLSAQMATPVLRNRIGADSYSPLNPDGSFDIDRVLKTGILKKRTHQSWKWKQVQLVLRPNVLFIYKNPEESGLRHKIYLSDLTAVALLKDRKQKRQHMFGLFSPSRNFHFQADSAAEAQEWVNIIRNETRIEEEEDELFLASPPLRRQLPVDMGGAAMRVGAGQASVLEPMISGPDRMLSSSPEPVDPTTQQSVMSALRNHESSGLSANEVASHSDFSDTDIQRLHAMSIESLAVQPPPLDTSPSFFSVDRPVPVTSASVGQRFALVSSPETNPDRPLWVGRLLHLRSMGGVRTWRSTWAVLRARNLILYKTSSESEVELVLALPTIVNVVEIDPVSRTKRHCLQVITEEKSYRFCAKDEESQVNCLGTFKSLLARRRELEAARATGGAETAVTVAAGQ